MITIRKAASRDVDAILTLIRELAVYEKLEHEVTATATTLHASLFGPTPHAFALLAEADGELAGFCLYFYNFSTFLGLPGIYIEDLYVRPPFRKLGAGKKLLAEICAIARDNNCGRIEWAVLNWNQPAIDFYARLGAEPMKEWTTYRLSRDKWAMIIHSEGA